MVLPAVTKRTSFSDKYIYIYIYSIYSLPCSLKCQRSTQRLQNVVYEKIVIFKDTRIEDNRFDPDEIFGFFN
jgi:hypothetical protein